MRVTASRLVCFGCGHEVAPGTPYPFRCPRFRPGDDVDHVLRRRLDLGAPGLREELAAVFSDSEPNPFLRFRPLFHGYQEARRAGWGDAAYRRLVERLDTEVQRVDGRGFRTTPFEPAPALAAALGVRRVLVKDETGNVGGTHKARHLMALALWLEAARELHPEIAPPAPLAIASCGNAALAAAIVARALDRPLTAFVPAEAEGRILARLDALGAVKQVCADHPAGAGDPAVHGFRAAVAAGALPFGVQGPDNGLTLEGGATLGWEIAAALARRDHTLDRLLVQVGGGALAAATWRALDEARALGVLARLPRLHAVQTEASPLVRAWRGVVGEVGAAWRSASGQQPPPADAPAELAGWVAERVPPEVRDAVLHRAARRRSRYMRPWEGPLASVAASILDDETYDWLMVVEGMLATGGWPLTVPEELLLAARRAAREATGEPITASGSAGLAGALALSRAGLLDPDESLAVLFTAADLPAPRGDG
ncbi:MAG: pyridoxal-phosphate dependent enzyme [Thermoanaerobaculia bacterium]|nr:pyridoxal-phosphate dependent enzyme [Thermoanaerobaculia bacterium]